MIKLKECISLSERKTVSGRFSVGRTKTFERKKTPYRKPDCLDCDNGKLCSDYVVKPKMKCSNCEMSTACKLCLDMVSQNITYSTDFNSLKRQPPNEKHQVLPTLSHS